MTDKKMNTPEQDELLQKLSSLSDKMSPYLDIIDFVQNKPLPIVEKDCKSTKLISSMPFRENVNTFPKVPEEIGSQLLFHLANHFASATLNTQRNFWAYLMIECSTETYLDFLSLHSQPLRERVSPVC